jgi:predicted tellurium resistance membrane protein TerC
MMNLLFNPQVWFGFLTLTGLELVLGIDNIIFISVLVDRLPNQRRDFARRIGLFRRCLCGSHSFWCFPGSSV